MSPQLQEFCRQEGCQVPEYVRTYATTDNVSLNTLKDEIHAVKAALDSADLRPRIKKKIIPILQSDDSDIQPISMALEQKRARWPLIGGAEPATYSSDAVDSRLPHL